MLSTLRSFLAWVAPWISSLLVLGLLLLIGFLGYRLEWKIAKWSDIPRALWLHHDEDEDKRKEDKKPETTPLLPGRVRLASAEILEQMGLETTPAEERDMSQAITAPGEIEYDPSRLASVTPRSPGTIWKLYKQVGDKVQAGEVLAVVEAVEVGKAKTELLQALLAADSREKEFQRLRGAGGVVGAADVLKAEVAVREARLRSLTAFQALTNLGLVVKADELSRLSDEQALNYLRSLGLPPELTTSKESESLSMNLLPLRAPFAGEVLRRTAALGENVSNALPCFTVVDLSRVWLTLYVRSEDARWIDPKFNQQVAFTLDSHGPEGETEEVVTGIVDWVSPEIDEKSHTVRVRARLDNPEGRLRPGTFGAGRIVVREQKGAITVPSGAVHWDGGTNLVFVKVADTAAEFEARLVFPGLRDGKRVEVRSALPAAAAGLSGLLATSGDFAVLTVASSLYPNRPGMIGIMPGDEVVTAGSHALKAELFKDRLGSPDE